MDELRLANEHLVFKWTSMDPDIKCSEVVAAINVNKVTPEIITAVTDLLRDTMPIFGFNCAMAVSDAAGCNWVSFKDTMSTHSISDVLPTELMDKYPDIDFDVMCVTKDPHTEDFFIFLPDMPHLTKNIVTALELSSNKTSKRNIKYGRCPVNLKMGEHIWLETDGGSGQFHPTKLTVYHFDKNAHSRMNVALAIQFLSASVAALIRMAIVDDDVELPLSNKNIYNHLANLCEKWNDVVDICNGVDDERKDSYHTPKNAKERQTKLLDTLDWFTRWKSLHDERVDSGDADEFNFFAPETWFCIQALLLAEVAAIQIYCVEKGESIRPRCMNTDTVEWHFGDIRQMALGSTNKMTACSANSGDKKAMTFEAAKASLVGNNASGANHFGRQKRF